MSLEMLVNDETLTQIGIIDGYTDLHESSSMKSL